MASAAQEQRPTGAVGLNQTIQDASRDHRSTIAVENKKRAPFKQTDCKDLRTLVLFPPFCVSIWLYYRSFAGKDETSWAKRTDLLKIGGGIYKETLYKYRGLLVEFGWLKEVGKRRGMIVFESSIGRPYGSKRLEIPDTAVSGNSTPEVDMKEQLEREIKCLADSSNQPERVVSKKNDDASVEITGEKKENSAKERKAPGESHERRKRRHEMAAKEIDGLYRFFYEQVGLDPAAIPAPTPAHRKMANDRFLECAKLVMIAANCHAEGLTDQEWVERAANRFGEVIASYCENRYIKKKTWSHLRSADAFRAELAPRKERVMG